METIEREELRRLLEERGRTRVVMTLGPRRYQQAHIPGTETFGSIEHALSDLQPDDDIVVYCSGAACFASGQAYRVLISRGYRNVRRYEGGLNDWSDAGLPLASGSEPGDLEVAA